MNNILLYIKYFKHILAYRSSASKIWIFKGIQDKYYLELLGE